jgi:hypothetical protein
VVVSIKRRIEVSQTHADLTELLLSQPRVGLLVLQKN